MTVSHSDADFAALASLERKMALLRDRVTAVARGFQHGLYLYGSGGLGKSYTVLRQLDALETDYRLFNSRMTARGLYRALERSPDSVHVMEDMERLTQDRDAQGVLRSALWAQPGHDRTVTWTTGTGGEERFPFRGGIILLANRALAHMPELQALATRISVLRVEASDAELAALIRDLAGKGFVRDGKKVIEPEECGQVADYLIQQCHETGCPLDLRLLTNSYSDYLMWESDAASCGWQDLVASRIREAAHHFRAEPSHQSQEERRAGRRQIVAELLAETDDPDEQLRLYKERTGRSRADFFRRRREVQSGEFEEEA